MTAARLGAARLLAALAGALILLLAVGGAGAGLRSSAEGPRVAAEPPVDPTGPTEPKPDPTTPEQTPVEPDVPSPADDAEPFDQQLLDEITEQVAQLRGLASTAPIEGRVLEDEALAEKVAELIAEESDPQQLEIDRQLLVALRLIPEDLDLARLLEDLYLEQVVGLYVPSENVLYVGGGVRSPSPLQRSTLAHEVVHALQDQHFDLEAFVDLPDERADEVFARTALAEGDAVLTQELWGVEHLTPGEYAEMIREALEMDTSTLDRTPEALVRALTFPYVEGAQFAMALYGHGGMAAIDAAFDDPPSTSEHILHPDKYLAGEQPASVTVTAAPGGGWQELDRSTVGEFDLQLIFDPLGRSTAAGIAEGWNGGQLAAWSRSADDGLALSVALAFDTPADATQACQAVPQWYEVVAEAAPAGAGVLEGDRDWLAFTCSGDRVSFALGPDEATARALVGR